MKLSEIKTKLAELNSVDFELQNGTKVPDHFHVTEVGVVHKHFIDCGGTIRNEKMANFQLWNANDTDHRLKPQKLLNIIELSENKLGLEDLEIEVEYQMETICKYGFEFNGKAFVLMPKFTDCLASDSCGIPQEKKKVRLSEIPVNNNSCCSPDSNCC